MLRMQRLLSLWNWLPTFRAVAEQQHISRAATELGVSPSAVSRMVGLLEEDLGQPLFNRVGRNIELNEAGTQLLTGLRSAMRLVDESLASLADTQFAGEVRIACEEPVTRCLVLPSLGELRREHRKLVPSVRDLGRADVAAALLRGELDVAFVCESHSGEQLSRARIGTLPQSIYVAAEHRLVGEARLSPARLSQEAFVVSDLERNGVGWPRLQSRQVAVVVPSVELAAEQCATSELLAVLPHVVAERFNQRSQSKLVPLRVSGIAPLEIIALWRVKLHLPGRAEAVVDAVKRRMHMLSQGAATPRA